MQMWKPEVNAGCLPLSLSSLFPESEPGLYQFGKIIWPVRPVISTSSMLVLQAPLLPVFRNVCLFVVCVSLSVCLHITYVHMTYGGQKSVTSPGTGITDGYEHLVGAGN